MSDNIDYQYDESDMHKMVMLEAAYNGDLDKIKDCFNLNRVNINIADEDGQTCLHIASSRGHVAIVNYLLSQTDIIIDKPDHIGFTPLLHACLEGREAVFDILRSRNANINAKTNFGASAMTLACGSGHINIVNRVIAFTPVRTEKIEMTSLAPTPLMAAVFSNQLQICTLLYKRGIDLDTKHPNFLNLTALSLAIMFSPLKIPRLLIYYGANYQKKCFRNLTAEEMSHKYRNKSEFIELFSSPEEENSNNKNNLQNILLKNDIKVLKSYFEKKEGMSKEEFFSNGFTPLMFCVLVSNIECLKILGDEDYEIDAQDGYSTMTALMFAVLVGDQEMITYLMAKNADIRIKSKDNFTALDLAYLSNFISRDLLCKMEKAFYEVEIGFKDSFTSIKSNSSSASLMNRIKQPMKFAFFNKLSAVKTFGDSFEEEKSSDDNGRKRFLNQFEETKLKSIFSENFTTANDIIFNKKFFKTENDTKSNPYAVFAAKMAKDWINNGHYLNEYPIGDSWTQQNTQESGYAYKQNNKPLPNACLTEAETNCIAYGNNVQSTLYFPPQRKTSSSRQIKTGDAVAFPFPKNSFNNLKLSHNNPAYNGSIDNLFLKKSMDNNMFYKSEDRLSNLRDNVHQRSSSSSIPNVNNRNAEYSSYQSPPTRIRSHAPLVPSTTSAFAVPKPNYNIGNRSFRDDKSHEDSYDLVKKHLETVNLGHLFETLKREEVDFDAFKLMTWKAFHNMGIKTDEEKEKLVHLIGILNIGKNTNDKIY